MLGGERAVGVGGGGGGRFELDPGVLAARLDKWRELRDDLLADKDHGNRLLHASSAGDEPASKTMANLVRISGDEFLQHNTALVKYVNRYIAALTDALVEYADSEDSAVRAVRGQIR